MYQRRRQVVAGSTKSGDVIARVRATDADAGANAILTYSLEGDANDGMFTIAPETGVIRLKKSWSGSELNSNDAEKETVYHLVVVASDGGTIQFLSLVQLLHTPLLLVTFAD